jgi:mono/diheme cytochrome c family protein
MRSQGIAAFAAGFGLAVAAGWVLAGAKGPDARAATKGQITYLRYCVSCHGPGARGEGPLAGDLRIAVPDLTTLGTRSDGVFPYERVVRIIKNGETLRGHGSLEMPAWGDAFKKTKGTEGASIDEAIANLAHFVWSLQRTAT